MPIVGTKSSKFNRYAFTVDFGHGPVAAQRCSLLQQGGADRPVVRIERGVSEDRTFANLLASQPTVVSINQLDRARRVRISYVLRKPSVTDYSVGPWDNESSEFAEEGVVIAYSGFTRTEAGLTPEEEGSTTRLAAWQNDVFSRATIDAKPFASLAGCRFSVVSTSELERLRKKSGETDA